MNLLAAIYKKIDKSSDTLQKALLKYNMHFINFMQALIQDYSLTMDPQMRIMSSSSKPGHTSVIIHNILKLVSIDIHNDLRIYQLVGRKTGELYREKSLLTSAGN